MDWKQTLRVVAPTLASALGGPLAGAAVSALGTAILGKPDASTDEVAAAIASGTMTGEQLVAMKQADLAFQTRMRELDIDLVRLDQAADAAVLADVQSARARQMATGDWMPQVIFGLAFFAYIGQFLLFIFGKMPDDEFTRALVTRSFGTVDGVLLTCVAYFVGSSRGSKRQGDANREIAVKLAEKTGAPQP